MMSMMSAEEVIALALATGAAAHFRPNNWAQEREEVDAYLELVAMIADGYRGVDPRLMEPAPGSEERRALLAEQLRKSGAAESRTVLRQSRQVLEEALEFAPEAVAAVLIDEETMRQALADAGEPVEESGPPAASEAAASEPAASEPVDGEPADAEPADAA